MEKIQAMLAMMLQLLAHLLSMWKDCMGSGIMSFKNLFIPGILLFMVQLKVSDLNKFVVTILGLLHIWWKLLFAVQ